MPQAFMLRGLGTALVALAAVTAMAGSASAQAIRFGAVVPLTGPATVIGTQEKRGLEFAVEDINAKGGVSGHQIELVFEDNQAKPDLSVLAFNKLIDLEKVPAVFTGYSGPTLAMAPLATRRKELLVNCGAQADKLATASPYLFNTIPSSIDEVSVMAKYLVGQGKKRAAILYENDAAGIGGRDDFVETFPKAGGTIIDQEPVQFGQTDMRAPLLKLAASKPDVLFVVLTANNVNLAQQYKQLNMDFLVAGTTFMEDPPTIADASSDGFIHTQVQVVAPEALAARFKAKYGDGMDFFATQYYNGAQMVMTALEHVLAAKQSVTGDSLRDAIYAVRKFNGIIPLEFTTNTAKMPVGIVKMHGGSEQILMTMAPG